MGVQDVINGIQDQADNTSNMDYIKWIDWSSRVGDFAECILGILVLIVLIIVPIVIALEVLYINAPVTRNVFDKLRDGTTRVARVAEFCLRDAVEAVEQAYCGEHFGNANMAYLCIKCKSLMVIGFAVSLALQGGSMLAGITYGVVGKAIIYIINLIPS